MPKKRYASKPIIGTGKKRESNTVRFDIHFPTVSMKFPFHNKKVKTSKLFKPL